MKKLMALPLVSNSSIELAAIISCIALISCISSANAAARNTAPQAPSLMQPRNFSGLYVGANLDYGVVTPGVNVACISPALNFSFSPNCQEAITGEAFPTHYTPAPDGIMGAMQAGYDFRFANVVLGLVTDIAKGNISGNSSSSTDEPGFIPEFATVDEKINWLGTLRGRLGFAIDNFLPYITGGLAYGRVTTSYSLNLPEVLAASQTSTRWQSGWTLGAGGELSFGKFAISAEYLYFNLGHQNVSPSPIVFGMPQPATYFPVNFDVKGNLFRLGINVPIDL